MTRQEKYFVRQQIKRLEERKESVIDEFLGACGEINKEIKYYKKILKEGKYNENNQS